MTEHSERDGGQAGDDQIMVGWDVKPLLTGSFGAVPLTRSKSDVERAMATMFRLAEEASSFEDCIRNFERAAKICREYGLPLSPPAPPPHGGGPAGHQGRMDAARIVITIILVLGVLVIVGWTLGQRDAATAAQYVAPVSGLAGIGLGWLFTNQRSSHSSGKEDDT